MTDALSLSGGGAKGDFQLGALRYLYESGIRPTIIRSTPVGSVNAIKLAEGYDPADTGRGLAGLERQWEVIEDQQRHVCGGGLALRPLTSTHECATCSQAGLRTSRLQRQWRRI
jgi:predicted acylesterase/phospholipase RssA